MDGYIGQIVLFAGNFAPQNWAFCDGRLLPISSYSALFSIIGTTYGGNGQNNFALPDLRSRVPVHVNINGVPTLPTVTLGQTGGVPTVTLTASQMPAHNHMVNASSNTANTGTPENGISAILADFDGNRNEYGYQNGTPNVQMNAQTISTSGQSLPHDNMSPYLGLNYIICLTGIFPSRN